MVEEREGEGKDEDAFWTRVGSAWPHKDGKGYNIVLSALPLNGRLVLREFSEDDDKADDGKPGTARRLQETITVAIQTKLHSRSPRRLLLQNGFIHFVPHTFDVHREKLPQI